GDASIIILSRELTEAERKSFDERSVVPRIYSIAYDAVVMVSRAGQDTTIKTSDVIDLMTGRAVAGKSLVIDNPNSSVIRYFRELGKIDKIANTYKIGRASCRERE